MYQLILQIESKSSTNNVKKDETLLGPWKMQPTLILMFRNSDELVIYFFLRGCRTEVLVSVKKSGSNPGSTVSLAKISPQGTKGGLHWLPSHVLASRPQSLLDPSPILAWPCHLLHHSDRDKARQRGTLPLTAVLWVEQGTCEASKGSRSEIRKQ